ncbi:hypothetical protein PAPYR_2214 [Paratrimastix pyriformis]|uniref:Uncharacterized protein n=1 Tax=Paratrimastix pyriformis TaxID=342808 RepID=A0ABQ8URX1_9EUKA|nr:hypothetical protein PAPYR_2214 [Paratrimastix pyriformis]
MDGFTLTPLSLDALPQIIEETTTLCKALNEIPGPGLKQVVEDRCNQLQKFYAEHELDERALDFEAQRLKLRKALANLQTNGPAFTTAPLATPQPHPAPAQQTTQQTLTSTHLQTQQRLPDPVLSLLIPKSASAGAKPTPKGKTSTTGAKLTPRTGVKTPSSARPSTAKSSTRPRANTTTTRKVTPIYDWEIVPSAPSSQPSSPSPSPSTTAESEMTETELADVLRVLGLSNGQREFQVKLTQQEYEALLARKSQVSPLHAREWVAEEPFVPPTPVGVTPTSVRAIYAATQPRHPAGGTLTPPPPGSPGAGFAGTVPDPSSPSRRRPMTPSRMPPFLNSGTSYIAPAEAIFREELRPIDRSSHLGQRDFVTALPSSRGGTVNRLYSFGFNPG